MLNNKMHALVILDGFGISKKRKYNAIYQAKSIILKFMKIYSSCTLDASGQAVGLFDNLIGNSKVGHLTIGAGRIIKQPITIIHEEIANKSFFQNKMLIKKFNQVKRKNNTIHIMGLLSDAGVHSHIEILFALLKLAKNLNITEVIIHPFLDGRDVPPKSASKYLLKLEKVLKTLKLGRIGSLHGRFYAMDRDDNWNRTKKSYEILTDKSNDNKLKFNNWQEALDYFYSKGIEDEFITPCAIADNIAINDNDGLIFFNIREDRARQLTRAIFDKNFNKFKTNHVKLLWFITAIQYASDLKTDVICKKQIVKNTLFDIFQQHNITIFSIAESEKYAHITYFFNGGEEIIRPNETRVLIKSESYNFNYTKTPTMRAPEITNAVLKSVKTNPKNFYLINYANADMVGHSGKLKPTIEAVKCLDEQIKILKETFVEKNDGVLYITSDHGKAEDLYNTKIKQPITSHTTNKVPFIVICKSPKLNCNYNLSLRGLKDIAPFILKQLKLKVPKLMKA